MAPDGNCGRMVGYGEVSSEPDHDDPARDPSFRIGGDTFGAVKESRINAARQFACWTDY